VNANPTVNAGADKATCAGTGVALSDATQSGGNSFSWSDGGAGGSFSPSSTVLNPTYTNAAAGSQTLTVTVTDTSRPTNCATSDTVVVTVNANPTVNAGADKTVCATDSIALDDSSASGGNSYSWSDGGAGGTFSPSASVLHPSYSNATA